MKKLLFISIFSLVVSFVFAQSVSVDENVLKQVVDILQSLMQKGQLQVITSTEAPRHEINVPEIEKKIEQAPGPVEIKLIQPKIIELPKGIKPLLPQSIEIKPITPEIIRPILPDEDRSDDAIVQINNLRITRILLDPGIQNVKAIFFAVRDTGWKCMLFESEESGKSLPCVLDVRRPILQKELAIQITDDTILFQRNRQKAKLEDFQAGGKINVYGFMDKDNYSIDALIVRNIVSVPKPIESKKVCPLIAPACPLENCLKAGKELEKRYGCDYTSACEKQCQIEKCGPMPLYPTREGCKRVCKDGKWQEICEQSSTCGKIQCIRYDPVCGTDNKTYACGEADAKACGVDVAYKGECKKPTFCIQVIAPAYNLQNPLECKEFPTPCDVPPGWIKTERCPVNTSTLQTPTTQTQITAEAKVESDDYGFYPSSLEFTKGAKVKLYLYVRSNNVYYGGLDFRSEKFKTESVKPGQKAEVEFIADKNFIVESYWPLSNVKKAELKVVIK